MYDQFVSDIGIDENLNWLECPLEFIVPLPLFLDVKSLLCNPKFAILSYTDCIHIVTSPDSDYWKWCSAHDNSYSTVNFAAEFYYNKVLLKLGVHPTGIPHSEIHIYPLLATNAFWIHVTSMVATHQDPNSILRSSPARFFHTLTILCHMVTSHMHELEAYRTTFSWVSVFHICPAQTISYW
jgi:hypothetical protein